MLGGGPHCFRMLLPHLRSQISLPAVAAVGCCRHPAAWCTSSINSSSSNSSSSGCSRARCSSGFSTICDSSCRAAEPAGVLAPEAATAAATTGGAAARAATAAGSTAAAAATAAAAPAPAAAAPADTGARAAAAAYQDTALVELLHAEDLKWPARPPPPFCDFLWVEAKGGRGGAPTEGAFRSRALGKGPGYGGHGGSVLLRCSSNVGCLYAVQQRIAAAAGGDAQHTSRGLHAADTIVKVPPGTIVRKRILSGTKSASGRAVRVSVFWQQLLEEGQSLLVAAGGRGGIAPPSLKQQKKRRLPEGLRVSAAQLPVAHRAWGFPDAEASARFSSDKRLGMRILRHFFRSRIFLYVVDPTLTEQQQDPRLLLQQQQLLLQQPQQQPLLQQQPPHQQSRVDGDGEPFIEEQQHQREQQQQEQQQQQQPQLEEDRLLAVYGHLSPDVFCQFLRLRRELRLSDPHFNRKAELVVVTKCDALDRHPLLAVDSLHHRMRHFFPDTPVIAASPRFGLGCGAVAAEVRRLLLQQQQQLAPLGRRVANLEPGALVPTSKP
ncbi:hypothetical protein ACSSS7_004234 [Eimeria intestinalis]